MDDGDLERPLGLQTMTEQARKTRGMWSINGACIDGSFLLPLEPFRAESPTLAGALRAFARHIETCGATWHTTVSIATLTITRDASTVVSCATDSAGGHTP